MHDNRKPPDSTGVQRAGSQGCILATNLLEGVGNMLAGKATVHMHAALIEAPLKHHYMQGWPQIS